MKTLTIIGNGFDLGHNLPTRFDDFINSNFAVLSKKYAVFHDENINWNAVESKYKQLLCNVMGTRSWTDIAEEVDNIIQEYGYNQYGEVNCYNYNSEALDEEYKKINFYLKLLKHFERDFLEYLKTNCSDEKLKTKVACNRITEILTNSNKIINFNYTNTIEIIYDVKDVTHIHGNVNDDITIGCGTLDEVKESMIDDKYPTIEKFGMNKHGLLEMMDYYENDMDGELVEKNFIKNTFDEVSSATQKKEKAIFTLLDEKNKDSLALRKKIIESLQNEQYGKVFIIGHSLGEADIAVLNAINKDAIVTCFYHTDKDFESMKDTLEGTGWKFDLLLDVDLYNKETSVDRISK